MLVISKIGTPDVNINFHSMQPHLELYQFIRKKKNVYRQPKFINLPPRGKNVLYNKWETYP